MSPTWSESRRAARSTRHLRSACALALLVVVALGCGSSTDGSATTSSAPGGQTSSSSPSGTEAGPGATDAEGRCITRMPGEILSAEEAVVRFTPSQVCPGYVTITPGTPVTFLNADTQAHTITITEGNLPDGTVVTTGAAEPGERWVQTFDTLGTYSYVTDAIPSFRGTVEVTTGDGSH